VAAEGQPSYSGSTRPDGFQLPYRRAVRALSPIQAGITTATVLAVLIVVGAPTGPASATPQSSPTGTGAWSSMGGGASGGDVGQVVRYDDSIVIGGNVGVVGGFSAADHVGLWADDTWRPLGNVGGSGTNALAVSPTGQIHRALNQAQIQRWTGSSWTSAVSPSPNNFVNAMTFKADGTLVAGGSFTTPASRIGSWNGSSWSGFSGGPTISVSDLAIASDDSIYVTSYSSPYMQQWNGSTWSTFAGGATSANAVDTVAVDDSHVYVGGGFTALNGQPFRNVAVAVNGQWSGLGYGLSNAQAQFNYVYDIVADDTTGLVYVAGAFTYACGNAACSVGHDDTVALPYVGAWYPARQVWIPLTGTAGGGPNDQVSAVATSADGRTVYAGGNFGSTDGVAGTRFVARFDWNAPMIAALDPAAQPENTPAAITLSGQNLEALRSITVDGLAVAYTQIDDTTVQISLPAGTGTREIRAIAAGGTSAPATFTFQAPVPPQPTPASAPMDVRAEPGDGSARVAWLPPDAAGSYPVTHYLVTSEPGRRMCLTQTLTCTVNDLRNGTPYTFTVSALTGAGWGSSSVASDAVTPHAPSVMITGVRAGGTIAVEGTVTGVLADSAVPWTRKVGGSLSEGMPRAVTDGAFAWERRARSTMIVYFTVGAARSNALSL